ncbi:hypothetical protein HanIR_Chr03g0150051 [Helianthus annuus]|nr:hypothetical protein HanIR_Chr03g0150051 [Helianthus annuus]
MFGGFGFCAGSPDSHKFLGPYVLSMVQVFRKYPWSKLDKMVAESAFDVSGPLRRVADVQRLDP